MRRAVTASSQLQCMCVTRYRDCIAESCTVRILHEAKESVRENINS